MNITVQYKTINCRVNGIKTDSGEHFGVQNNNKNAWNELNRRLLLLIFLFILFSSTSCSESVGHSQNFTKFSKQTKKIKWPMKLLELPWLIGWFILREVIGWKIVSTHVKIWYYVVNTVFLYRGSNTIFLTHKAFSVTLAIDCFLPV